MSSKPIFCCTHPRACSTAFERVFMSQPDVFNCVHEPFGDAFYFGPERLSSRYEKDEAARAASGFADSSFATIFERIEEAGKEGNRRLFIKDITHYLVPPEGKPATIAPSLIGKTVKKGVGTNGESNGAHEGDTNGHAEHHGNGTKAGTSSLSNGNSKIANGYSNGHSNGHKTPYPYATAAEKGNPTVVPASVLSQFHFTFLIRHPRSSIPSYYRCTIPPLDAITGFYNFMPSEAGYSELRSVFDFLRSEKQVGPAIAGDGQAVGEGEVSITVIDADDLLDDPEGIMKIYCKEVGIAYTPQMLNWETDELQSSAKAAFEKWPGFHDDAINSTSLRPRSEAHKKKTKSVESENAEWREKYGETGQKIIREAVEANIPDYEYLRGFAIKL